MQSGLVAERESMVKPLPSSRTGHEGLSPARPDRLTLLQQGAGNRAVGTLLQRRHSVPPAALRLPVQRCGPIPCGCGPDERAAKEAASLQRQMITGVEDERPVLKLGSSSAAVAHLQVALNQSDVPPTPALQSDGTFGPMTRLAVVTFQASRGLSADGVVGPRTWEAFGGSGPAADDRAVPTGAGSPSPGQVTDWTGGGAEAVPDDLRTSSEVPWFPDREPDEDFPDCFKKNIAGPGMSSSTGVAGVVGSVCGLAIIAAGATKVPAPLVACLVTALGMTVAAATYIVYNCWSPPDATATKAEKDKNSPPSPGDQWEQAEEPEEGTATKTKKNAPPAPPPNPNQQWDDLLPQPGDQWEQADETLPTPGDQWEQADEPEEGTATKTKKNVPPAPPSDPNQEWGDYKP